jgi:H2-forming N5,N10-methylenetetrahydromethanopterin dehydrogenase-like enzyme
MYWRNAIKLNIEKKDEDQKPMIEDANNKIVFETQDHVPKTKLHVLTTKFGKTVDLTKFDENIKNL